MHGKAHSHSSMLGVSWSPAGVALAIMLTLLLLIFLILFITLTAQPAMGQAYQVIHNFTGGADGAYGYVGLTPDRAGNFYGTAWAGGTYGYGTVFKLNHSGSGWVLTTLYSFAGGNDGATPWGRLALAQDGTLYGTTAYGGGSCGCGTVFHLTPPPTAPRTALTMWNETVIHRFTGSDGEMPLADLTFDPSGNIYGTTFVGGSTGNGVVYQLTPSGGSWTETVLYSAQNNGDGRLALGGVVIDRSGDLYSVFALGGPYGYGAVYQLSPSGSGWTERTIYGFTGGSDGAQPMGGLILDSAGNLYGETTGRGNGGGGTLFELSPAGDGWTFYMLYGLSGSYGGGPSEKPILDAAGNLYDTAYGDGAYGWGSVFKLTPSYGGWTYTALHDFTGGSDGGTPSCTPAFDAAGNLYGTTRAGGAYGYGVLFEITP
ncbi:MAG: choice-of-anchor tandem repeat GloVer-containing protein [Candidatus Korobacteraceae bacterium]|jgi:uncharacterized repeat protein (TIGR03803 family)